MPGRQSGANSAISLTHTTTMSEEQELTPFRLPSRAPQTRHSPPRTPRPRKVLKNPTLPLDEAPEGLEQG